jgi:hypothetical protein
MVDADRGRADERVAEAEALDDVRAQRVLRLGAEARTRSGVSSLDSVVRSISEMARSSQAAWLSALMERRLVSVPTRRSSAERLTWRISSSQPRSSGMPGLRGRAVGSGPRTGGCQPVKARSALLSMGSLACEAMDITHISHKTRAEGPKFSILWHETASKQTARRPPAAVTIVRVACRLGLGLTS